MDDPTKQEVDAVLDRIAQKRPVTHRLPPLASMTWTEEEKQRLRPFCAQMVRYRVRRSWLSLLKSWGKSGRT